MTQVFVLIVIFILALLFIPIAAIWAINTLFTLAIEYSMLNWFAVLVLVIIFGASSSMKK